MPPVPNRYFCIQLAFVQIPIYLPSFVFVPVGMVHAARAIVLQCMSVKSMHFTAGFLYCNVFTLLFVNLRAKSLRSLLQPFPEKLCMRNGKHTETHRAPYRLQPLSNGGVKCVLKTGLGRTIQSGVGVTTSITATTTGGFETWMDITLAYLLNCSAGFPCNVCKKKPYPPIILPKGCIY